jgi:hypothetical protein
VRQRFRAAQCSQALVSGTADQGFETETNRLRVRRRAAGHLRLVQELRIYCESFLHTSLIHSFNPLRTNPSAEKTGHTTGTASQSTDASTLGRLRRYRKCSSYVRNRKSRHPSHSATSYKAGSESSAQLHQCPASVPRPCIPSRVLIYVAFTSVPTRRSSFEASQSSPPRITSIISQNRMPAQRAALNSGH